MRRLERLVQDLNTELYNPVGLHIRWPRKVAFLFVSVVHVLRGPLFLNVNTVLPVIQLEIEYYVSSKLLSTIRTSTYPSPAVISLSPLSFFASWHLSWTRTYFIMSTSLHSRHIPLLPPNRVYDRFP